MSFKIHQKNNNRESVRYHSSESESQPNRSTTLENPLHNLCQMTNCCANRFQGFPFPLKFNCTFRSFQNFENSSWSPKAVAILVAINKRINTNRKEFN